MHLECDTVSLKYAKSIEKLWLWKKKKKLDFLLSASLWVAPDHKIISALLSPQPTTPRG